MLKRACNCNSGTSNHVTGDFTAPRKSQPLTERPRLDIDFRRDNNFQRTTKRSNSIRSRGRSHGDRCPERDAEYIQLSAKTGRSLNLQLVWNQSVTLFGSREQISKNGEFRTPGEQDQLPESLTSDDECRWQRDSLHRVLDGASLLPQERDAVLVLCVPFGAETKL